MEKQKFYGPEDLRKRRTYYRDIGNPGEYPFTRAVHKDGYAKGHLWTMRQFAGAACAEWTNERFKMLLESGQTGLSVAFDMATLLGLDSDNPRARHHCGIGGVGIDTIADMEKLFLGIDLSDEKISTSMTINAPASILLQMYFATAQKCGASLSRLRGTVQADPFKEYIAQNEYIIPPRPFLRIFTDMCEYCLKVAPRWNPVSISGYHIREAGATAAEELALTLSNGIAYAEALIQRGIDVDSFAPRLSFFFDFHNDFFVEISKLRAARRMWAKIMKKRFHAKNDRSCWMRMHVQTAGITLTKEQPLNNIGRVAIQALGAVLAGTQSLHTNSYDEELNLPSEGAVKTALRTQQIIAYETGVTEVVDPFGGSYAMESMTADIESEADEIIREIDQMGGMLYAVESGWAKRRVQASAGERQKKISSGEIKIVGQNIFNDEEPADTTFEVDPKIQDEQIEFLRKIKRERDKKKVGLALLVLKRAIKAGENCMPYIKEAVVAYATEQEIFDVFRDEFGEYRQGGSV